MKVKWQVTTHPEWFERTVVDIGLGHEGWSKLIDEAFTAAEQILSGHPGPSFAIKQVKEKFGALTIYFRDEGLSAEASDRLSEIFYGAKQQSLHVCEFCGAPACLGSRKSCLSVRCTACAPAGWAPYSIEP